MMDEREELEIRRRLTNTSDPREELELRRQLQGGTIGDELARQKGLFGRAAVNAISFFPAMLADAATGVYNTGADLVQGKGQGFRFKEALPALNAAITTLPTPATPRERVVQAGAIAAPQGLVGGASLLPAVSAATGAMSSQAAAEAGASPAVQLGAGLAGGFVPAGVSSAAHVAQPVAALLRRIVAPYSQAGRDSVKAALLRDVTGAKRPLVLDALQENKRFVRGTQNDAVTAAAPADSTELAGLSRVLSTTYNATVASEQDAANAAARLAAVHSVGKTPQALAAAVGKRAGDAAQDYAAAFQRQVRATPELARLVSNPYVKEAVPAALKLAKAKGVDPGADLSQFLHLLKLSLDDQIAPQAGLGGGLGPTVRAATIQARDALVQWLERANPAYATARANFARNSRPINQMQVGQYLENKLRTPLGTAERSGVFAGAMREAPTTIRRASGRQFQELGEVLPDPQIRIVEGVLADLARKQQVTQQAHIGEQAARQRLGATFATIQPPGMLDRGIMLTRAILERMQKGTSEKVMRELAGDFQSPEKIAALLAKMPPEEREAFVQQLRRAALGVAAGATAPPQQE